MGRPKALCRTPDGVPWLVRAHDALLGGGCDDVLVVVGAAAADAEELVPAGARVVVAERWPDGMSASLGTALRTIEADPAVAAVVTLVDLPDLDARAVARVAARPVGPHALRRAAFAGSPGHPVLLGRAHWAPLRAALHGDAGARDYLGAHGATTVDCTGLPGGQDHDTPAGPRR